MSNHNWNKQIPRKIIKTVIDSNEEVKQEIKTKSEKKSVTKKHKPKTTLQELK
jgi:hypothetical protein